ncbi:MAG: T9SS type A sorting domain-containing protein, partial [Saprospiraceae bacterium]
HLQQIHLWPNPANEMMQLSFNSSTAEVVEYTFTNFLGQVVMKDKLSALKGFNKHTIDVSAIPEGTYLVQVKTDNETHTKKMVIIRTN